MMLTIGILGYLAFGLLLMTYMCPCWHPFEWLIGAIIWPISLVIGIVVLFRGDTRTTDALLVFQLAFAVILAEQAATKLAEEAKPKAAPNA